LRFIVHYCPPGESPQTAPVSELSRGASDEVRSPEQSEIFALHSDAQKPFRRVFSPSPSPSSLLSTAYAREVA
jgi:hypothetical protein